MNFPLSTVHNRFHAGLSMINVKDLSLLFFLYIKTAQPWVDNEREESEREKQNVCLSLTEIIPNLSKTNVSSAIRQEKKTRH